MYGGTFIVFGSSLYVVAMDILCGNVAPSPAWTDRHVCISSGFDIDGVGGLQLSGCHGGDVPGCG